MSAFGLYIGPSNDIAPFIKYNAKAGRFYRVDRRQEIDGWQNYEVDISNDFEMLFDFSKLEAGHANFGEYGPEFRLKPYPYAKGDEPKQRGQYEDSDGRLFKPAFRVTVILRDGEEREFAANAGVTVNAVAKLYQAYERERPSEKALPIVVLDGTPRPDRGSYGNFTPVFAISGWVEPDDIGQWLDDGAEFKPLPPREEQPKQSERRRDKNGGGFSRTLDPAAPDYDEQQPADNRGRYERARDEALARPVGRPPASGSSRRGPPGSGGSMNRRGLV